MMTRRDSTVVPRRFTRPSVLRLVSVWVFLFTVIYLGLSFGYYYYMMLP